MAANNNNGTDSRYKECRRNQALAIGRHAVDGCREFTPSGPAGTEAAFHCEACGCHRSFHRRVFINDDNSPPQNLEDNDNDHHDGEIDFEPKPPTTVDDQIKKIRKR